MTIFTTVDSKTEVKTLSFNMVRLTKVQKMEPWVPGSRSKAFDAVEITHQGLDFILKVSNEGTACLYHSPVCVNGSECA